MPHRRTSFAAALSLFPCCALGLFLLTALASGSSDGDGLEELVTLDTPLIVPVARATQGQDSDKIERSKLFREWTTTPDAVIVFSGQQHGYLEPCGCSPQFQKGGLARRLAFVNSLRQQNWPLALVDIGGILEDHTQQQPPGKYIIGQEQALAKLEVALEAMQHMGYTVVNFSPEELSVPNGFNGIMGAMINIIDPAEPRLLNNNVEFNQVWVEEGLLLRSLTRKVGKLKIGFIGVLGERHKERLNDAEIAGLQPPDQAIQQVLPELIQSSDLQVLLLADELGEAKRLAQKFPDLDVIIHGAEGEEPPGRPEWVGDPPRTMLVTIGSKGKYTGAIGIFLQDSAKARFELVPLDDRFDEDKHIRELLDVKYIDKLNALNLVPNSPKVPHPNGRNLTFVGSSQCQLCHPEVVKKWSSTRHAHALETLVHGVEHNGKKIAGGKQANPECASCHVTGFAYLSGFDGTEKTKHLGGNGCENCHGPASDHVAAYMNPNSTAEEKRRATRTLNLHTQTSEKNFCTRCHDAENDPAFEFDDRWAEIDHLIEAGMDQKLWPKIRELLSKNRE